MERMILIFLLTMLATFGYLIWSEGWPASGRERCEAIGGEYRLVTGGRGAMMICMEHRDE